MAETVEGVPVGGDPPPVGEEVNLAVIDAGESGSPVKRQLPRKMALRSRGRLAKSRPKSPLLRMAEMRKSGLRGRALRQDGKKGSDDYEAGISRGKKGRGNRGTEMLPAIPEIVEEGEKGIEDVVAEMMEDPKADSLALTSVECSTKQLWQKEALPAGIWGDCSLDLLAAQPLQEMGYVIEQVRQVDPVGDSGRSLEMRLNRGEGKGSDKPSAENVVEGDDSTGHEGGSGDVWEGAGMEKEFPPLSKESLRVGKGRDRLCGSKGDC